MPGAVSHLRVRLRAGVDALHVRPEPGSMIAIITHPLQEQGSVDHLVKQGILEVGCGAQLHHNHHQIMSGPF